MSLYIPKMSDTPGVTIPGLADNFNLLEGSRIVEQGKNENGEYARWENGLQICWGEYERFGDYLAGNEYHISYPDYPASFVERPVVSVSGLCFRHSASPTHVIWAYTEMQHHSALTDRLLRAMCSGRSSENFHQTVDRSKIGTKDATSYRYDYVAIGRWK